MNNPYIQLKRNKKYGRYLIAAKELKKGQLIEVSELIIISKSKDIKLVDKTIMSLYVYGYQKSGLAIALGIGSLFNHSFEANVEYQFKSNKLYFKTNQKVKKGSQLFIDYGYQP